MYIKKLDSELALVRTRPGADGEPEEVLLALLGQDPELNLFVAAQLGRLRNPELWEGIHDFHLLQALENYKRRIGGFRPALVAVKGRKRLSADQEDHEKDP